MLNFIVEMYTNAGTVSKYIYIDIFNVLKFLSVFYLRFLLKSTVSVKYSV